MFYQKNQDSLASFPYIKNYFEKLRTLNWGEMLKCSDSLKGSQAELE